MKAAPKTISLAPTMVAEEQRNYLIDHVVCTDDEEAAAQIEDHLDWIRVNIDEGDSAAVRLENLASLPSRRSIIPARSWPASSKAHPPRSPLAGKPPEQLLLPHGYENAI
jgi:hypothetical protein